MTRFKDPLKDIRTSLALMSDPLKEHREMMASFTNSIKDLRASLVLISDPFTEIRKTITDSESLKLIRDIALEVQPDIVIDSKDMVALDTKCIVASELQELSDKIFNNSSPAKTSSLEESINNLANEISSQKDPLIQRILAYIVYPLIFSALINPIADHHIKSYLSSDKRAQVKELKANVHSAIDNKDVLGSLRYVSTDTLNVRVSGSVKSEIIGYLRFSYTVLIIEKQKSWTLIEWNDSETDVQLTGWVFSRYLAKFR